MRNVAVFIAGVIAVAAACFALVLLLRPPFAQPLLQFIQDQVGTSPSQVVAGKSEPSANSFGDLDDPEPTEQEASAEQEEWLRRHRTPLIASAGGIDFRCPIASKELTGVLFHQASYNYALVFETKLPEADYERVASVRSMRINTDQQEGDWLDAEALHLWRTTDATAMDTSIDVGALPGTVVRSPISGTVVLVKDYLLYDTVPDIEIHIQPDGAPDLDCVLIHTADPLVKAGEHVDAGLTEISHVRDIERDLVDVQLAFFTPEGVGGNHVHVQLNDATTKGYRKDKLKGAVKVKE